METKTKTEKNGDKNTHTDFFPVTFSQAAQQTPWKSMIRSHEESTHQGRDAGGGEEPHPPMGAFGAFLFFVWGFLGVLFF